MASHKVCVKATLCSLLILSSFIGSTESASCCLRYSKRHLTRHQLLGYSIQTVNNSCDIDAIIFHIPGSFVCADPEVRSTQQKMRFLDEKRKKFAELLKRENIGGNTPTPA